MDKNLSNKIIDQISNVFSDYKFKKIRYDQNSINGIFENEDVKYFFKVSTSLSIHKELSGHTLYNKYNKCPRVEMVSTIGNGYSIILFEYIESLDEGANALYYAIEDDKFELGVSKKILSDYFKTFQNKKYIFNLKYNLNNFQYLLFFKNRISRVREIKSSDELFNRAIFVSCNYVENMRLESLRFLTHGDPSDMNFSRDGYFYDFEEVEYNDINLEFVIILWNFFIGGGYIYPKYHCNKYQYRKGDSDNISNNTITKNRRDLLLFIVVEMEKIYVQNQIVIDNKIIYCLIFRILSVVYFEELEEVDQNLLISQVKMLYSWSLQTEVNIFEKLSEWIRGEIDGQYTQ